MAMRKHPIVELMRYLLWLLIVATTHNPIALFICLVALWCVKGKNFWRQWSMDGIIIGMAIIVNGITNHRGETYLFYLNDNVVTLESLVYGGVLGLQIVLLIHIAALMSRHMTADKIVIVTGYLSPSMAILFSMAIRNVERYHRKIQEIYRFQKCESSSESLWERLFISIRTVSILVNWALENGLEVSDSMVSRGYGSGRRTSYAPIRLLYADMIESILLLCVYLLWLWGQPDTILCPYIAVGIQGWWMALTVCCMIYEIVEERNEDRYLAKNNIRQSDSARHISGDW
ncbi:MAG: energy-coupling factor transporter transmembrane component T [Eubacteriales bacterium]|nr:energy-coupling factor transporter transmembrane component T [Eubacteriales bacterium]